MTVHVQTGDRVFTTFSLPVEAYGVVDQFDEGPSADAEYAEDGTPDPGPCPIDGIPHMACTSPNYNGIVESYPQGNKTPESSPCLMTS